MLDVYCIHLYRLEEGCDSIDYIMTHEKGQKGKTLTADFVQLTLLLLWTSLGLNQGPPDYESICNIFHKIINNHKTLIFNAFFIL